MQPTPLALPQPGRDFGSVPLPSLISPHTAASAAAELCRWAAGESGKHSCFEQLWGVVFGPRSARRNL